MAHRHVNSRLVALLAEAGWSSADLARAVNALGDAQGLALRYDRTSVAHWRSGSRPRHPVTALVAAAFSQRLGCLVTAEETGLVPPAQGLGRPALALQGKADAVHELIALCRQDATAERRVFLARSVYSLTAVTLPDWEPEPKVPSQRAHALPPVTQADVQALRDMARIFAALAQSYGGAHARSALVSYIGDDAGPLLTASVPAPLRRELFIGAAQLTHLLGDMTADAGYPGLAQRYCHIALALAHQAGGSRQYAITLRAMSLHALRLGHRRHAFHLADGAVQVARSLSDPAAQAFLLAQRARTHAANREHRAALADLASAERHHEHATGAPGPFTAYPRSGLDFQRAQTLEALGERPQAVAALESAVRHRAPAQRRAYALTHARLAEVLLTRGHLEAACAHWHTFLDCYPHLRSAHVERAHMRLRENLRPFGRQPQAAGVRERARALGRPQRAR